MVAPKEGSQRAMFFPSPRGNMLALRDPALGACVPGHGFHLKALKVVPVRRFPTEALREGPGLPKRPVHSTEIAHDMPCSIMACIVH